MKKTHKPVTILLFSSGGHDAVGGHYGSCGRWGRGRGMERVGWRILRILLTVLMLFYALVPSLYVSEKTTSRQLYK